MKLTPPSDNNSSTKRLIIAVALSFAFIIGYSYYVKKYNPKPEPAKSEKTEQAKAKAPELAKETSLPATSPSTTSPSVPAQSASDFIIATVKTRHYDIEIDNKGRMRQVYLKDKKFLTQPRESLFDMAKALVGIRYVRKKPIKSLPILDEGDLRPLSLIFADSGLNTQAASANYSASSALLDIADNNAGNTLVLKQTLDNGLIVTKTLTFFTDGKYILDVNFSQPDIPYFLSNGARPVADLDTNVFNGVILRNADDSITKIDDDASLEGDRYKDVTFMASVDRYYTSLFYTNKAPLNAVVQGAEGSNIPNSYIEFRGNASVNGYIGPKAYRDLDHISKQLTDVIEYGMITFFAKPCFLVLQYFEGFTKNWGYAIILLTILVRIILFPITYKGMVSMQKLKDLGPKMKELQAKYKGEPQKLQMHTMELYKKHGANPMSGCLPLIVQIPVFFAIYRVLYNSFELKAAPFIGYINDLSVMDPYLILPLLMGISMYVHQLLTPNNLTDPMQAKLFKFLPVVFTLFLITFPAGLVLYWTTNNILSIVQQLIINKMTEKKKEEFAEEKAIKYANKHSKM